MGEAYWDVVPELAGTPAQDVALKTHYGVGGNEEVEVGGSRWKSVAVHWQLDVPLGRQSVMAALCAGDDQILHGGLACQALLDIG